MSDLAVVCGRVTDEPQIVMNEKETRCIFVLGVESRDENEFSFARFTVITDPGLTEKCRLTLKKDASVLVLGQIDKKNDRFRIHATGVHIG